MPKNTRNVTFPIEQGMYERLQAFKKAPGLGVAARRALQYLIDHPNEVLDPKPKGSPTMQQKPELKDEPGKREFKRRIWEGFNRDMERAGYPELTDQIRNRFYVAYRVNADPPVSRDILDDAWDLIRSEYPAILEKRRKEKRDAEAARIRAEEDRQKAIQAKADQERRAIEELTRKGLNVLRYSRSDMSISEIRKELGLAYGEEHKLDEILTALVAEGKIIKMDNLCYYPVPNADDLKAVLDRVPYEPPAPTTRQIERGYHYPEITISDIAKYLNRSDSFVKLALGVLEKEHKVRKDSWDRYFLTER